MISLLKELSIVASYQIKAEISSQCLLTWMSLLGCDHSGVLWHFHDM